MKKKKSIILDRERTDRYFEPIVKRIPSSITPNFITAISIIPPIAYLLLISFSGGNSLSWLFRSIIFIVAFIVFFFCTLDGLDGALARKRKDQGKWSKKQRKLGNFLDHSVDRLSDVIIFLSFPLAGYCRWELFSSAVVIMLLVSYLGALAEAVYGFREYGGILGRFRRLLILWIVTLIVAVWSAIVIFYPDIITVYSEIAGFRFFDWIMIIFITGGLISFFQRFYKIYRFGTNLIKEERE